jgi:hypothetical protein
MAHAPRAANGDDFVRHIVHDPKNVPDVMLLYGYPGASSEEGHERLYLSPDLSTYVEVPNGSILHRAEASKERDPNGGVTLWVKKDAALKYRMAPAQEAAQKAMAWYFAGALQGGGAGQAGPQVALPQTLPNAACPVTLPNAACPPVTHATCVATCQATCQATCGVTCHATCGAHATCGVTCIASCNPTCHVTCVATCAATCPPQATCGATCAATCHATCPPHATCVPACTHATPCVPTHNQPDCPYPTEVCTHVAAQCTHAPNCRLPQAQAAMAGPQAAVGAGAQIGCALGTVVASVQVVCSIACPTRYVTCNPANCPTWRHIDCPPHTPWCHTLIGATCAPHLCTIGTCNPDVCVIASGALGCGGGEPGPGPLEQAQFCLAGSVRPPQVTIACTIGGGCQSLPCPSWQYTCGWCPPRTPACPW